MRHVGKEAAFGCIGIARIFKSIAQCLLVGQSLGLIGQHDNPLRQSAVRKYRIHPYLELPLFFPKRDIPFLYFRERASLQQTAQPLGIPVRHKGIQPAGILT